jgi:hypothetical protein
LDDVQEDLQVMGIEGWRGKAAGGQGLRRAVEPCVGGGGGGGVVEALLCVHRVDKKSVADECKDVNSNRRRRNIGA